MKISTFIHVYDNKVWDALHKNFIDLSKEEIDFIVNNKEKEITCQVPKHLIELGIVTTIIKEKKLIEYLKSITTDSQFQSLFLITTTSCNLDCDYCFYRSSSSQSLEHRQNMSFDTAKHALDDFSRITNKNIKGDGYWQQVTFYGGEPLINKPLLYKAIPYTRALFDLDTNLVINTNATLLEKEDIKLFKDNHVEAQVSIDGSKEMHDLHRKHQNGAPSYDIVIANIKRLLDSGVKVLPMITATDANIDNFSNTLYKLVTDLGIDDFAVNVLITNSFNTNDEYTEKLATEMLKAYREFGTKANDYAFVELYNRLLGEDKTIARNSCGSSRKITIFPNGNVYACQALEKVKMNLMKTINDDYENDDNWSCWRNRSRFDNNECLKCGSIMSCGGGCATGSYNACGSIYDIDQNNCQYTKKLFKKIHNV
jgi:uncharacterized protein